MRVLGQPWLHLCGAGFRGGFVWGGAPRSFQAGDYQGAYAAVEQGIEIASHHSGGGWIQQLSLKFMVSLTKHTVTYIVEDGPLQLMLTVRWATCQACLIGSSLCNPLRKVPSDSVWGIKSFLTIFCFTSLTSSAHSQCSRYMSLVTRKSSCLRQCFNVPLWFICTSPYTAPFQSPL